MDPDVTSPLPPLSPDLIWSFVSGKETSKFFDVDSIESADTTGRINAQWAMYVWHNEIKRGKKSILSAKCTVCLNRLKCEILLS